MQASAKRLKPTPAEFRRRDVRRENRESSPGFEHFARPLSEARAQGSSPWLPLCLFTSRDAQGVFQRQNTK